MKILTARFVNGQLEMPDGAVREGDTVTLLVPEHAGEEFELSDEEVALLEEAVEQADRGEGITAWTPRTCSVKSCTEYSSSSLPNQG